MCCLYTHENVDIFGWSLNIFFLIYFLSVMVNTIIYLNTRKTMACLTSVASCYLDNKVCLIGKTFIQLMAISWWGDRHCIYISNHQAFVNLNQDVLYERHRNYGCGGSGLDKTMRVQATTLVQCKTWNPQHTSTVQYSLSWAPSPPNAEQRPHTSWDHISLTPS